RLTITGGGVSATAPDRGGLFYAAVTFAQIVRLAGGRALPCCEIEDAPDFPLRGVMLDVSRDKVPTLDTLLWLVDRLADLKFNHLQLYVEHTFAYRNHREVWQHASPLTADDIHALDAHCAARCIELVPNQNSFGHMERWLAHPRYLPLAELPQGGAPLPWGGVQEAPSALCPTDPRTFALLAELYDEYLPNFSSRLFNVGCDETFDLRGGGRSRQHIGRLGEGRVYLDYLLRLHGMLAERGFRMAFWGDIIISHPGLVPEIPKDALVLEWGYEADHPFDAHGAKFAAAGVPFCVCPGTSSWNSLGGRTDNMIANLTSAAENGLKHGACGYIVCDWGDGGHWHPLALSFPGLTVAAGLSWCLETNRGAPWTDAADAHLTEGLGKTLFALGEVYRLCGATRGNGTELFHILSKPLTRPVAEGVTWEKLRDVYHRTCELEKSLPDPLRTITWWRRLLCAIRGKPLFERESILQQELRHAIHLTQAAVMKGWGMLDKTASTEKTQEQIQRLMNHLIEDHRRVWLLRNREGGLADSIKRLERIRDELQ
ncbi:MAG: family 20 glycosylhydrolase, partial [Kiritimatiellaeota bacterium]|nr:family 20 glycosylhydrolase [Kiritimatiellota bacterium]